MAAVAGRRAPDGEADEIDGEEATAADHVGDPECERGRGERGDRSEGTDRVRQAREHPGCERAERDADHEAETQLLDHEQEQVVDAVVVWLFDPRDQAERERDRHRVVSSRLGLERACEPATDVREAKRREDGRGVGGRDDGPEQHGLQPREVEESVRGHPRQHRADDDADRAQQGGRYGDLAQAAPRGLQAALVEDQRQSDDADLACELCVVELDPARSVRPEDHPDRQKRRQNRQPSSRSPERDDNAARQDAADEQKQKALVHASIFPVWEQSDPLGVLARSESAPADSDLCSWKRSNRRRVEHFRDGDSTAHAQDRAALGDRAGGRPARLRLLLRAAQAHGHPSLDHAGRGERGIGRRLGARPAPAGDARRARADVRQVRAAALDPARCRPAGHRRRAARASGRRLSVPVRTGARGRRGRARPDARAGVHRVRRDADRGRLDRPGASGGPPERRPGRRQGAAPERAESDRERPRPPLPGCPPDQGACPRARLHRRQRPRRRVRALHPPGARLQARGAARRHVQAQLRRFGRRRRPEGLLGLLRVADADARVSRRRAARRPGARGDAHRSPPRAGVPGHRHLDGDDLPARLLPRRSASGERARARRRPDRPRRLRPRRQAHRGGHGAADPALHRRGHRERRRAAAPSRRARRPLSEGAGGRVLDRAARAVLPLLRGEPRRHRPDPGDP